MAGNLALSEAESQKKMEAMKSIPQINLPNVRKDGDGFLVPHEGDSKPTGYSPLSFQNNNYPSQ
jgi:hypothetical protein